MREIKFEILWLRNNADFTKSIEKHYTTLERLTNGEDKFPYSDVNVVARRQYAELKDKSGVEAYEGDWVKPVTSSFVTGYIVFSEGAFWVSGKNRRGSCGRDLLAHYPEFTIEANIHQNPELVGK